MRKSEGITNLARMGLAVALLIAVGARAQSVPARVLELPPSKSNPRNSEGSFATLKDGRILFVYTYFTGGGGDHDSAHLAGRYSADGGRTWTAEDSVIVPNEGGMNVMSVSLLRLKNDALALFYLLKNSERDCRPVMRLSRDEGATWSEPVMCVTDEVGYYVLNNDRAIQLASGRLVLPLCLHTVDGSDKMDWQGRVLCYLSDDGGSTWRRSRSVHRGYDAQGRRVTTQEPGVVELKDGRVMMVIRASGGCQYLSWSPDGGETWSAPVASDIKSPVSPATIKRLPSTGDLLLVWNDHDGIPANLSARRVPLSTAISKDDGKTWQNVKVLEGNPQGHYCYIAIHPVDDAVLLGYCAMSGLGHSRVTRVPVSWLYAAPAPAAKVKPLPPLFDPAAKGPFERIETRLGVWIAEAGHAEILSYARGTGLRLQGGPDRQVTLTLPQPVDARALKLGVERFTAQAPYALELEAKVGDAWQKVWGQGEKAPTGVAQPISAKKGVMSSQFRFRCTSKLGAIIVDAPDQAFNGFFND